MENPDLDERRPHRRERWRSRRRPPVRRGSACGCRPRPAMVSVATRRGCRARTTPTGATAPAAGGAARRDGPGSTAAGRVLRCSPARRRFVPARTGRAVRRRAGPARRAAMVGRQAGEPGRGRARARRVRGARRRLRPAPARDRQDIRKREGFNRPIEIDQAVFLYCNGKSHFSRNAMENLNKITGGEISLGPVDFL